MSTFSSLATSLIDHLGVAGVALGVGLNGLGVPGMSEVLLPLAGVAVRQGHQSLGLVFVAAMAGQLIGLTLAYFIGRYAGVEVIERYGRYVLITHHDLERAQKAFERHGTPLVIVGALVPGLQGVMGYIGGIAKINLGRFLVLITIGKVIWIGGLIALGYALGDRVNMIDQFISRVGLLILVALLATVIWYIHRQKHAVANRGRTGE